MGGMAFGAPAQVNDHIVVTNHGERLDHLGRGVFCEFTEQRLPGLGIASDGHGDRGGQPDVSGWIGKPVPKQMAGDPGLEGQHERRPTHRDILMTKMRGDERSGEAEPGIRRRL